MAAQTCSTHHRQAKKPWTWLQSNMCEDDYQAWKLAHPSKPWYKSQQFWYGVVVIGASVGADYKTTSSGISRGYGESNPLLGSRPSDGHIAAVGSLAFTTYFGLHLASYQLSKDDPSKYWRFLGHWQIPVIAASIHGPAAKHNSDLP